MTELADSSRGYARGAHADQTFGFGEFELVTFDIGVGSKRGAVNRPTGATVAICHSVGRGVCFVADFAAVALADEDGFSLHFALFVED